jgi:hypothetical protein
MNKKFTLLVLTILAVLLSTIIWWQESNTKLSSDQFVRANINSFAECAAAGLPIMESYPRQCRAHGRLFVEPVNFPPVPPDDEPALPTPTSESTLCQPDQRNADVCIKIYAPVCGKVNVQCIKAPCYPVEQTFGNSCEACANPLVESYVSGECVQ